jgi:hypothetical protein
MGSGGKSQWESFFTGTFDGNGNHIDNLFIDDKYREVVGLFGTVKGTVENVHVRSGSVTGKMHVAGVVGSLGEMGGGDAKTVRLCSNNAVITGDELVGGVVGGCWAGEIYACYNTGSITGTGMIGAEVGCVAGRLCNTARIAACYNTGAVTGQYEVGGVVGYHVGHTVIACYNTGTVSGVGGRFSDPIPGGVGGIVGCMRDGAGLTACYNTGSVEITSGDVVFAGGVLGVGIGSLSIHANYWFNVSGDNADYGIGEDPDSDDDIGSSDTDAAPFSGTAWPSAGTDPGQNLEWGTGNGSASGNYWKSLGGWNDGNPIYPRLWYEE